MDGGRVHRTRLPLTASSLVYLPVRVGCVVWMVMHGYLVCLLLFLNLPLSLVFPRLYWRVVDLLYRLYYVTLCSIYYYVTGVVVHSDRLDFSDSSHWPVVITNHRSQLDWLIVQTIMLTRSRWTLHVNAMSRSGLSGIVSLGLVSQFARTVLVQNGREQDKQEIIEVLRLYKKHGIRAWFLVCPEGVILHAGSLANSLRWEDKHTELAHFNRCLHPRAFGLHVLLEELVRLKMLGPVYDLTLACEQYTNCLHRNTLLSNVLKGPVPRRLLVDLEQLSPESVLLAAKDEQTLSCFLEQRFHRKELLLSSWEDDSRKSHRLPQMKNQNSSLMKCSVLLSCLSILLVVLIIPWTIILVSVLVMTLIGFLDGILHLYKILRVVSDDLFEQRKTATFKFPLTIFN
jgi:hypothetical protein